MSEEYVQDMHRICQLKRGSAELIIQNALATENAPDNDG